MQSGISSGVNSEIGDGFENQDCLGITVGQIEAPQTFNNQNVGANNS